MKRKTSASRGAGTLFRVSDNERSLEQRLEEIGAQLAWVRDYL
jgi:hypothetical protein